MKVQERAQRVIHMTVMRPNGPQVLSIPCIPLTTRVHEPQHANAERLAAQVDEASFDPKDLRRPVPI